MPDRATALNTTVLRWARERAGLSVEAVAASLKKPVDTILAWESGHESPTYRQLEDLADRLYKRPTAIFFFPAPPDEDDPRSRFRTLPQAEFAVLAPDTLYAIREAVALQDSARELRAPVSDPSALITRDLRSKVGSPIVALAREARAYLGKSLKEQSSWRNADEAFKRWRLCLEGHGICVFKRSFKQTQILGLSVFDDAVPLILVNNSTSHSRQIFTLFHELAHLLYSVSGITKNDNSLIDRLTGAERDIEVKCNHFAAEFLVPEASFPWREFRRADLDDFASLQARRYNVSREVILRRLLDRGLINRVTYTEKVDQWNLEYERSREGRTGGNYYATQAAYLGETFLKLAFSRYYHGALTLEELASHLRVKARNVSMLEEFVSASG